MNMFPQYTNSEYENFIDDLVITKPDNNIATKYRTTEHQIRERSIYTSMSRQQYRDQNIIK